MGDPPAYGWDYYAEGNQYQSFRAQSSASGSSWAKILVIAAGAGAVGYAIWQISKARKSTEPGNEACGTCRQHGCARCAPEIVCLSSNETEAAHRPYRQEDVDAVLGMAISRGLVGLNKTETAIFYDMDAIQATILELRTCFPPHFLHTFAVKSAPLPSLMKFMTKHGIGMESASFAELSLSCKLNLAYRCDCPPANLMFDSPAKTRDEIRQALLLGVQINVDNFDELDRVHEARNVLQDEGKPSSSRVAFRINPLVGSGTIQELSVSDKKSKFGVPLSDENKERIIERFSRYPFLDGLHMHVGSQGFSLEQLSSGVSTCVAFADEIDERLGVGRVRTIDIGGGMPLNYTSFDGKPTYKEYAELLKSRVPSLFSNTKRHVVTEFGRSMIGKTAWCVCSVEYTKEASEGRNVAIVQAGADLFMRTAYLPSSFPLRITAHTAANGRAIVKQEQAIKERTYDVAGPLCFAGDLVATGITLPELHEGDFLVVHDAGANTLSTFSRHCSRPMPPVYAYSRKSNGRTSTKGEEGFTLTLIKAKETIDQVLSFWGY